MTPHDQYLIDAQGPNLRLRDWLKIIALSLIVPSPGMFAAQREREIRARR